MLYVIVEPGAVVAGPLLLTCRSADGVSGTELTAVLFVVSGSVAAAGTAIVAALTSRPVAPDAIVPVNVNAAVPPAARSTVVAIAPAPEDAPQAEPASAAHSHDAAPSTAGSASLTVAPVTALGPWFVTTME